MKPKIGAVYILQTWAGSFRSEVHRRFKRLERERGVKFGLIRKMETENQFGTKMTVYEATVVQLT